MVKSSGLTSKIDLHYDFRPYSKNLYKNKPLIQQNNETFQPQGESNSSCALSNMNQSDVLTEKQPNVAYLQINRHKQMPFTEALGPMSHRNLLEGQNIPNLLQYDQQHHHLYQRAKPHTAEPLMKFDPEKYFYLASYSSQTFINNDEIRILLYKINNEQQQKQKQNLTFLNLNPLAKDQKPMKYFVFPQEIIFTHLKNFELKIVD